MFRVVRTIHLYCSLVLGIFGTMYVVTGYVVARRSWFGEDRSATTSRTVALSAVPSGPEGGEPQFMAWLADRCGVRGRCGPPRRKKDGQWEVVRARPGFSAKMT